MGTPQESAELFERLCQERGVKPEDYKANLRKQGRGRLDAELVAIGIRELQVVDRPTEPFGGIYVSQTSRRQGGGSAQARYILLTPKGAREVAITPPPDVDLFTELEIGPGVVLKHNEVTQEEWYEVQGKDVKSAGKASHEQVAECFTDMGRINGSNIRAITKGNIQYVNRLPAEKYDPAKQAERAKQAFAPGQKKEKLKERPMYDPGNNSFALSITLASGSADMKVKVEDPATVAALYARDALTDMGKVTLEEATKQMVEWLTGPGDDDKKFESVQAMLLRVPVVALTRGGNQISRAGTTPTPTSRFGTIGGGDGWLMHEERYDALFGDNGHAGTTAAPTASPPTPATAPTPAASAEPIRPTPSVPNAEIRAKVLAALPFAKKDAVALVKKLGIRPADFTLALTDLMKEGLVLSQSGQYVAAPKSEPKSDMGSDDDLNLPE